MVFWAFRAMWRRSPLPPPRHPGAAMSTTPTPPVSHGSAPSRMTWMDAMRGFAVLLVMFTHTYTMPQGLDATFSSVAFANVVQVFQSWRMPMLVFLSGVLLPRSVSKPLGTYYRGKAERILWPFLVWMVVLALATGKPGSLLSVEFWRGGAWHLWFLWVLMLCYLIGPVIRRVPALVVAAVLFVLLLEFVSGPRDWVRPLYWGVYFFLGAASARLLPRIRTAPAALGVIAVILMVLTVTATRTGALVVAERQPWSVFAALPGILVVLWLGPRLPRLPFLEFCGRRSMVLYVAHMPVLILAVAAFRDLAAVRPVDFYVAIASFTFLVPLALALGYRRVRWLFEFPTAGRVRARPRTRATVPGAADAVPAQTAEPASTTAPLPAAEPAAGAPARVRAPRRRPRHPGIPATPALSNVTEGLSRVRKSP
ncbi:acyltransferase family protein [Micrococcus luteus]|uniref:acyltransferase family protein n=5 Tax=Bacteria TaxID=2 RepID=UPI0012DCC5DE|nr:acyltransferase [Micrococcus luteus]QGS21929.1 acyltransferase family protein [Micrococcus luteus]QHG59191.1 acyltransferase [Micrococcus luteus]